MAADIANNLSRSTVHSDTSFMLPLLITHICHIADFSFCVWNTGYIFDVSVGVRAEILDQEHYWLG